MAAIEGFRKYFKLRKNINWFPGHMLKGMRQMQQKLRDVDCVIEVHDGRIPLSGRNRRFQDSIIGDGVRPHILVLNKKDLLQSSEHYTIKRQILEKENVKNIIWTNAKDQTCPGVKQLLPKASKLALDCDRPNRSSNKEFHIMVIGVPNVGKSTILNVLRNKHLGKKAAAKVGPEAGVTRSVGEKIKISEDPTIYMFDTPGISQPRIENDEIGMKLALVGCVPDHIVGEELIADYLLFWLNKRNKFNYIEKVGLSEPTDDVMKLLTTYAQRLQIYRRMKTYDGQIEHVVDILPAARKFIQLFRTAELGRINLDDMN